MISSNYGSNSQAFLKSAQTVLGAFNRTEEIIDWINKQREMVEVKVSKIPFSKLSQWKYHEDTGNIGHDSGQFFSIDGIRVETNCGYVPKWEQPIINQPEVGYLGFITKEFNGVLHFLMQAKIEPGNINLVQLSPTLQATRSNYMQIHKGKKPLYLEYFREAKPHQIMLDQLQSEQGSRFLKKRNRNIIIKIEEDIEVYNQFIWATLGQIKELLQHNNIVNMDTRTVIAGINYSTTEFVSMFKEERVQQNILASYMPTHNAVNSIEDINLFLTKLKSVSDLKVTQVPLKKLDSWVFGENEIYHKDKKYFRVIAVDVSIGNREVVNWSQPMIEPAQEGICAFVTKKINGVLHFAVQAKMECGNYDVLEFAPTVQCLTGNYRHTGKSQLPFLDYILSVPKENIFHDSMQSEEGGRFYCELNRNLILEAGDEISVELPPNFIWMTLHQISIFLQFNNYLNIQARSLIAALKLI